MVGAGRYYCYTTTAYGGLVAPIWILFVRSRGMSFAEVGVLDGLFRIALVVGSLSIPTPVRPPRARCYYWDYSTVMVPAMKPACGSQ